MTWCCVGDNVSGVWCGWGWWVGRFGVDIYGLGGVVFVVCCGVVCCDVVVV